MKLQVHSIHLKLINLMFYLTKDVVFQFSAALTERVLVDEVVEVLATFSGGGSGNNLLPLPKKLDTVACFIL